MSRTPKLGIRLGLAMLFLLVAVIAWVVRDHAMVNQTVSLTTLEAVSSRASVRFPPGSKLIDCEWHHSLNSFGYARVELPPNQATEFLKQPVFGGVIEYHKEPPEDLDHLTIARLPHDRELVARWDLLHVKNSASAQGGELNGGPGSHIPVEAFVDLDQRERPVLYLHWYD